MGEDDGRKFRLVKNESLRAEDEPEKKRPLSREGEHLKPLEEALVRYRKSVSDLNRFLNNMRTAWEIKKVDDELPDIADGSAEIIIAWQESINGVEKIIDTWLNNFRVLLVNYGKHKDALPWVEEVRHHIEELKALASLSGMKTPSPEALGLLGAFIKNNSGSEKE